MKDLSIYPCDGKRCADLLVVTVFAILVITSGCQSILEDNSSINTESDSEMTNSIASTTTESNTPPSTPTEVPESVKTGLDNFAEAQESVFEDETKLADVDVRREPGTANLSVSFDLPDSSAETRRVGFENSLEALVQSQYNWIVNGSESNQAEYIKVETDYGTASVSAELLQLYVDGELDQETVAYIWAGKFDRYNALGNIENSSHTTRISRLDYTARVLENRMETNGTYVTNVETEVQDETLFVRYEHTNDIPNPTHPPNETAYFYYNVVSEFGVEYMPYNGLRAYDYFPNGTAQITYRVDNSWVTSEYVGLRPFGEVSLNTLNTIQYMDGPHESPP